MLPAHERREYRSADLTPGFKGRKIEFSFRPFAERRGGRDLDSYLELRRDLREQGMRNPLITHRGHVLIGMRRWEILHDKVDAFDCIEILEDVARWWKPDLPKLDALKAEYYV